MESTISEKSESVNPPTTKQRATKPRARKETVESKAPETDQSALASAEPPEPKPKKQRPSTTFPGKKEVLACLRKSGVAAPPKGYGNCFKAALHRGFLTFSGKPEDLDKVIAETDCIMCEDGTVSVTYRGLIGQRDCGIDYGSGSAGGGAACDSCDYRMYYGGVCINDPVFDCGKFVNHCTKCPEFGTCIGDYREGHCKKCNEHYFGGGYGAPCYVCDPSVGPGGENDEFWNEFS